MDFAHAWRRMTVYAVVWDDGVRHWRYTLRPHVDAAYWRRQGAHAMVPLEPPAPAMWAEYACRLLQRLEEQRRAREDGPAAPRPERPWRGRVAGSGESFLHRLSRWLFGWDPRDPVVARVHFALRLAGYEPGLQTGDAVVLRDAVSHEDGAGAVAGRPEWAAPPERHVEAVAAALTGRQLSIRELERLMEGARPGAGADVADCLAWLAAAGRVRQMPGVRRGAFGRLECTRCGETQRLQAWDCAVCGEDECWVCDACRTLGEVRSCTIVYAAATPAALPRPVGNGVVAGTVAPVPTPQQPLLAPNGVGARTHAASAAQRVAVRTPALTPAQERASQALAQFVDGHRTDALVWAVCGAGKTEMSFAAVAKELGRGGRVLFAIPRRDVVRELGRRLRAAFPDVELQVLHGGADRTVLPVLSPGSLTVATTHQVMRFFQAFDLVILDEVDAYPYRGSRMLAEAVVRATAPGGRRIRMTATPDHELLRQAEAGESALIRVPARYHGYPLPVPELVEDRTLGDALAGDGAEGRRPFRPSRRLLSLVERSLAAGPAQARVLVFVPTVALAEWVGRGLAGHLPDPVLWSHARDPERDEKLAAFLRGEARVFVATSILERGVTVPDVDVIVLYADAERIFQEPALIQMAGRVGRTVERPTGRVAFVGRRVTAAMRRAVALIEGMNEEAAALGLLRPAVPLAGAVPERGEDA